MNRQQLTAQIFAKRSFLCVGLDTDMKKLPAQLLDADDPVFEFNKAIIDATNEFAVAYKPNLAFYEAYGVKGLAAFEKTVRYIREKYPEQFVIADAKRGDIGNTSKMYARTFFEEYAVDALTVAPYMGEDSVTPFLAYPGCWVVLLALTSNKGSEDFQLKADAHGRRMFENVIMTSQRWGNEENLMYVVGATQAGMFQDVRKIVPRHFLLVPGVGAQGGSLKDVCRYGMTEDCGLIANASRSIIYAGSGCDFAQCAAGEARKIQNEMAAYLP